MREGATYREAGVDIEAGNELVRRIKPLAAATKRVGADASLGGFGALFDLKACNYKDPLLVSATDGVGTKLKIAHQLNHHDTIGIDLVAMCVNDLVVQGAEPLFFLDYFATGKLELGVAQQVIQGIAEGCKIAGCALTGGETAEMPSMYGDGEYDLAGFAVGAVERDKVLPRKEVKSGDVILGLASSGIHSNGYSLVRRIVGNSGVPFEAKAPFDTGRTLAGALLEPTRIYVKPLLAALKTDSIKALAHITGGGLLENIPRVLPDKLAAKLDASSWEVPPVFDWLQQEGGIAQVEMWRTFNCGIGMAVICDAKKADEVKKTLEKEGEKVFTIGEVVPAKTKEQVLIS